MQNWPDTHSCKSRATSYLESGQFIPPTQYRCDWCSEVLDTKREHHCTRCHLTMKIKDAAIFKKHVDGCNGTDTTRLPWGVVRLKAELQVCDWEVFFFIVFFFKKRIKLLFLLIHLIDHFVTPFYTPECTGRGGGNSTVGGMGCRSRYVVGQGQVQR
jgi:hypothetical protein